MQCLRLLSGSQALILAGEGLTIPWRGARRATHSVPGGQVEELLDLGLEGTPTEIVNALAGLQAALAPAPDLRLELTPSAEEGPWTTPVLTASAELAGEATGERARGSQGVRLRLTHPAYWEGSERALPLSNLHGESVTSGLLLDNCEDPAAGRTAHADVAGEELAGELAAPLSVELANTLTPGLEIGTVFLSGLVLAPGESPGATPPLCLEAEGAASDLSTAPLVDASCSGGMAVRLSWSAAGPQRALEWLLPSEALSACDWRGFKPLLRLAEPAGEEPLWAAWRLLCDGVLLAQSEPVGLAPGAELQELPPLVLPPSGKARAGDTPYPLSLALWLERGASSGSASLAADFLAVLPLDSWRVLRPVKPLPAGWRLVDDSSLAQPQALDPGGRALATHLRSGPGLSALPGRALRVSVHFAGGAIWPATAQVKLSLRYRPRRALV